MGSPRAVANQAASSDTEATNNPLGPVTPLGQERCVFMGLALLAERIQPMLFCLDRSAADESRHLFQLVQHLDGGPCVLDAADVLDDLLDGGGITFC